MHNDGFKYFEKLQTRYYSARRRRLSRRHRRRRRQRRRRKDYGGRFSIIPPTT